MSARATGGPVARVLHGALALLGVACFAAAGVASGAGEGAHPAAAEASVSSELPPPGSDRIPAVARLMVRRKMQSHAHDMNELMLDVTLLRHDAAKEAAQRILDAPRFARPTVGGEEDVNAMLPERFFLLQDESRVRAQAVKAAAGQKDDVALAKAFGRLMEICVTCHAAYLDSK